MLKTIDLELLLFMGVQWIFVLFIGYLAFCGLFNIFDRHNNKRFDNIDKQIDYYEKKLILEQKKNMYKNYMSHVKEDPEYKINQEEIVKLENDIVKINQEEIVKLENDIVNINPINTIIPINPIDGSSEFVSMFTDEKTGELTIPSMDEVIEKDPDFLQHSEEGPKLNLNELSQQDPIPINDPKDETKVVETLNSTIKSNDIVSNKPANKKKKKKWWFF